MAYLALYRRYRPKTFDEIVGQEAVTKTLKNQVAQNRIGHAYLFSGARGTGKTSTAKVLARAINCLDPKEGQPCLVCNICKMNDTELSMDIVEIDAASNNSVDEIRDLREKVKFAPALCKYRVYIIDEVHMLSTGAFNALLKTLEEPPSHTVFILATTEAHKLPATILSRCQRFDFRRIPQNIIEQQLKDIMEKQSVQAEQRAIVAIAKAAEGGMRDALSLLDQCIGYAGESITYEDALFILGATSDEILTAIVDAIRVQDAASALQVLEKVYDAGKDMLVFARDLTERFTEEMMQQSERGENLALSMRAVDLLSQAEVQMRQSVRPRVNLQAAIVRLCFSKESNITDIEQTALQKGAAPIKTSPAAKQQKIDKQAQKAETIKDEKEMRAPFDYQQEEESKIAAVKKEQTLQPSEKTVQESIEQTSTQQESVSKEFSAQTLYEALLEQLKSTNPAVTRLLRFSRPQSFENNVLVLAFSTGDDIIAQGVQKAEHAEDIINALESITANPNIRIQYAVGEHVQIEEKEAQPEIVKRAEKAFGMQVEIE